MTNSPSIHRCHVSVRRALDLVAAGAAWGGVAYLLAGRAFGRSIWPGVLAAPAIGLVVGAVLQGAFESAARGGRRFIALLSLYGGATLFALAIGLGAMLGVSPGTRQFPAALLEPVIGVWWGLTLTGFVIALWPMAYLTHWWLEWRAVR